MATQTGSIQTNSLMNRLPTFRMTRKRAIALALLALGLLMLVHGGNTIQPNVTSTLTLQPPSIKEDAAIPPIVIPTQLYMRVAGAFFIVTGILGLLTVQALNKVSTGLLVIAGIVFIPTILIIAAAGSSTNITTIIGESLRLATPIAIGAMAGIWCERSGIINIAIEGMMLTAAFFGFLVLFWLQRNVPGIDTPTAQFIAVCIAVLSGGTIALLHGWLSITFRTDQIVSGTVINILAVGITSFGRREYLASTEAGTSTLSNIRIPILADIPIIGDVIFTKQPIFFMMFVVIIATHMMLFYTRWGLRVRAVGEHPHAADTLGINVLRTRWMNVFISGMIAGLAGAWFSLEATGRFNDGMTRGAGFIALAAMIFGKWTPAGAFGAALLFGFSDALGTRLQIVGVAFPVEFLQMVPYLVTIVVLAGFIGRAFPPKAIGKPYEKE